MFTPPAFRETNVSAMQALIRSAPLANFVTATLDGPVATPVPLHLLCEEEEHGVLYGHIAKANPQWSLPSIGEALAIFMGPDAYISPSWYKAEKESGRVVPTWNYLTVHARGPVEFFDEPDRLMNVVRALTDLHEHDRPESWELSSAQPAFVASLLGGIVGIRMPIRLLEGKRKMSQNRPAADRLGVVEGLSADGRVNARGVAELVGKTLSSLSKDNA